MPTPLSLLPIEPPTHNARSVAYAGAATSTLSLSLSAHNPSHPPLCFPTILLQHHSPQRARAQLRSQRSSHASTKKAAKDTPSHEGTMAGEQPNGGSMMEAETRVIDEDPLQAARDAANSYNAKRLGAPDDEGTEATEPDPAAGDERAARPPTSEEKQREERRKAARRQLLDRRNMAAAEEVQEFEGTPEYAAKLAAAKRRRAHDFQAPQMVATFGDDADAVKTAYPLLLLKWHNTLTCKAESPFATPGLLDVRSREVVAKSLVSGYRDAQQQFELLDDDVGVLPSTDSIYGGYDSFSTSGILAHSMADGYEVCFELYPLEKTVKLLATAKACTDETTNVKDLFKKVIQMPVKVRTNYATAKVVDALERLLTKGETDYANNTLKVQVNYRPGNKISGVSRSYASHPSNQTTPNVVRVALLGPHLHDLDVAIALPTCVEIGLRMIGKDPYVQWPTGMEYVDDRRNGIISGKDDKVFQQEICAHYNERLTEQLNAENQQLRAKCPRQIVPSGSALGPDSSAQLWIQSYAERNSIDPSIVSLSDLLNLAKLSGVVVGDAGDGAAAEEAAGDAAAGEDGAGDHLPFLGSTTRAPAEGKCVA